MKNMIWFVFFRIFDFKNSNEYEEKNSLNVKSMAFICLHWIFIAPEIFHKYSKLQINNFLFSLKWCVLLQSAQLVSVVLNETTLLENTLQIIYEFVVFMMLWPSNEILMMGVVQNMTFFSDVTRKCSRQKLPLTHQAAVITDSMDYGQTRQDMGFDGEANQHYLNGSAKPLLHGRWTSFFLLRWFLQSHCCLLTTDQRLEFFNPSSHWRPLHKN